MKHLESQTATLIYGVYLLLAIFTVTLILSPRSQVQAQLGGSCHLRELDLCAATLLVFTQSPGGLATTEQEINKQCVHLRDADTCLRNYTRRCMTPLQREVVTFASNSSMQLMNEYCTRGSSLRNNYLKHSQCLNQLQKKEQKTCTKDLQTSLELLTVNTGEISQKRLQLACCTYRKFESCFGAQLEKRCGKEAVAFVSNTLRRITSRLPETMCRHYKPDGQECKALLPKPGVTPKGAKSNSIVSRLLSAYSGGLVAFRKATGRVIFGSIDSLEKALQIEQILCLFLQIEFLNMMLATILILLVSLGTYHHHHKAEAADEPTFPKIFDTNYFGNQQVGIVSEWVDNELGYQTTEEYLDLNTGKQSFLVSRNEHHEGILVDGISGLMYQYEPYKCKVVKISGHEADYLGHWNTVVNVTIKSEPNSEDERSTGEVKTVPMALHGVAGMWLFAGEQPKSYASEDLVYSLSQDTYTKAHIWTVRDATKGVNLKLYFIMSYKNGIPAAILDTIRVTSASDDKSIRTLRVFTISYNLGQQIYDDLFQVPVGFGCPASEDFGQMDEQTGQIYEEFEFPKLTQNFKLEFEATATKFDSQQQQQPNKKSFQTQTVELARGKRMDLQLIRVKEQTSDLKIILDHKTNVKYEINMKIGDCQMSSMSEGEGDASLIRFHRNKLSLKMDADMMDQLFEAKDGFSFVKRVKVRRNSLYKHEVEFMYFEKSLATKPEDKQLTRIIRLYSINGLEAKLESVSMWLIDVATQTKVEELYHLDLVEAKWLGNWPDLPRTFDISDECYLGNNRMTLGKDFAWFKLSYSLPAHQLELLAKHRVQVQSQLHYKLFENLLGFFRVPRVEMEFSDSSFSLRVLMLDLPPLYLMYDLVAATKLSSQSNTRSRSLMIEVAPDLSHCSELCQMQSCKAMSFCSDSHECVLSALEVHYKPVDSSRDQGNRNVLFVKNKQCQTFLTPEDSQYKSMDRIMRSNLKRLLSEFQHQDYKSLQLPKMPEELNYPREETGLAEKEYKRILSSYLMEVHDFLQMNMYVYPQFALTLHVAGRYVVVLPDKFELEQDPLVQFDLMQRDNLDESTFSGQSAEAAFHEGLPNHRYKFNLANRKPNRQIQQLIGFSFDQCSLACLDGKCSSFSFCSTMKECILSNINSTEFALKHELLEVDPNCVVYQRDFLTNFHRIDNVKVPETFAEKVQAHGASECALFCMQQTEAICLAFDYCPISGQDASNDDNLGDCYFLHSRDFDKLDEATPNVDAKQQAGQCSHFSRSFLADFLRIEYREINYEHLKQLKYSHLDGQSIYKCAESCALELDDCSAFQFCLYPGSAQTLGPMQTCVMIESKLPADNATSDDENQVVIDESADNEVVSSGKMFIHNSNCHVFALRSDTVEAKARELALNAKLIGGHRQASGDFPSRGGMSTGGSIAMFFGLLVASATLSFGVAVARENQEYLRQRLRFYW